ncbi:L,D-transpeptidase [Marinomonas transparens]|uniref:L,D-transpeptidase n=1 Tax=Marinomonas transparens TaxID=2795388 RepID=UPI0034DD1AC4
MKDESVDPCLAGYSDVGTKDREIHVNLAKNAIRVYTRTESGSTHVEFTDIIWGPVTKDMARNSGWCHLHKITVRLDGPTPSHGLLNFAVFCPRRQIGFHSDHHIVNGQKELIPGSSSAGCIRIPDARSKEFFDSIQVGDAVRLYEQSSFWRDPVFALGSTSVHCA